MEVLADPIPLVHDSELPHLFVQAGVLDGDPGVPREHLDQGLVGVR